MSASRGGVAAGGMFWQLLTEGLDSYRDGYDIVLSESPSIAALISQQSKQLVQVQEKYARQRHIKKEDRTMNTVEIIRTTIQLFNSLPEQASNMLLVGSTFDI